LSRRATKKALVDALTNPGVSAWQTEIEVHPEKDRVCSKIFSDPIVLPTLTSLTVATEGLFRTRADTFWVVSESGSWLLSERILDAVFSVQRKGPAQIKLICVEWPTWITDCLGSDEVIRDAVEAVPPTLAPGPFKRKIQRTPGAAIDVEMTFASEVLTGDCEELICTVDIRSSQAAPRSLIFTVRRLPWYRHNRHMTIAVSGSSAQSAVYFARRLRALVVTPVLLGMNSDLAALRRSFEDLWTEADVLTRVEPEP
jgi:hypothetical protein